MFKRRKSLSVFRHVQELVWPSMGWRRSFRYVTLRITRLSDSTHKIALGLSIGVAMAFNPVLWTHFIQAGLFALLLRANVLCALIGTFFGNPWTFPFMWWGGIQFGSYLFNLAGLPASTALPTHVDLSTITELIAHEPMRIFLPWLLGGYILGFLSMPLSYIIFYKMVQTAKLARIKVKLSKIHRVAREVTERQEMEQ